MYVGPLNLIVPEGVLKNSSDVFTILDPDSGGASTFSVALSSDGSSPATHYGTRTFLEEATFNALQNMTVQEFKAYVDEVATLRGREPVGSITAFKNSAMIDEGDFWSFAAANGLRPVVMAP